MGAPRAPRIELLVLAGIALGVLGVLVAAEVFDEQCFELGKQWVYEAKEMLLCDRSGRRININKFCKAHLPSAAGRLIIDSTNEDSPTETKKKAGHFPELCLPGQRSYALQSPWLCTCVTHRGRYHWECVVPENGAGRGLGSGSPNSSSRVKRSPADATTTAPASSAAFSVAFSASTLSSIMSSSVAAEMHDEGQGVTHEHEHEHEHNGTLGGGVGIRGRQSAPLSKSNIVIDFCDEFGYVHSVTSSMRECACDKDAIVPGKLFNSKDSDLYQSSGLFNSYDCLPGTYNVRCEVCYQDSHTCQPTPCA